MERREFLHSIGGGAAFALALSCLHGCTASSSTEPVDFTLDLSSSQYSTLLTAGNFVVANNCVIAHGIDGKYYAATVICSHEGEKKVQYEKSTNDYHCTAHDARYSLSGAGTNVNGKNGLTIYSAVLTGTSLRVHS